MDSWLSVIGNGLGTLLATIVGAVVALLGARALHRRESKARYAEALDEGIAMLIEEASLHRRAAEVWSNNNTANALRFRAAARGSAFEWPDPVPSTARFLAVLDLLSLRSKGADREVLAAASFAAERFVADAWGEQAAERAVALAKALLSWRVSEKTPAQVTREIDALCSTWLTDNEVAAADRIRSQQANDGSG